MLSLSDEHMCHALAILVNPLFGQPSKLLSTTRLSAFLSPITILSQLNNRPFVMPLPLDGIWSKGMRTKKCLGQARLVSLPLSHRCDIPGTCDDSTLLHAAGRYACIGCGSAAFAVETAYVWKGHLYTPAVRPALLATPWFASLATPWSPR